VALLGNLTGSSQFFNDNAFYNGAVSSSLRMQDARLTETPSSTGNSKKWTFSAWIKRGTLADSYIFAGTPYDGYNGIAAIYFTAAGQLHTYYDTSGANPYGAVGPRLFRDTSSWYHLVWAVDAANTIHKIWINNELVSTDTGKYPPNYDYGINRSGSEMVIGDGAWDSYGSTNFNGYMAEINHCDGQYLEPDSFGETKNGVWIPLKDPSLTYGTNGFRLQFLQTGTSANSSGIGADTSGQANHFAVNALAASDVVPDSPENNFATLNSLIRPYTVTAAETVSDGNLNAFFNSNAVSGSYWSTFFLTSGKWYFEVNVIAAGGNADVGISNKPSYAGRGTYTADARGNGYFYQKDGQKGIDNTFTSYGATYTTGDIIGCAFDLDNNTITFYKNNSSQGQITGVATTEDGFIPAIEGFNGTRLIANFGQDSSFAGNETAQGNTDANGIGDFYYAVPSGFLAVCSANLPEPTIGPNSATQADDHFNTVLISTGTDSETAITGVGFQPDFTWGKSRNSAYSHQLYDSSRGATKYLESDDTATEATDANSLKSFDSDGITIGTGSTFSPYSNGNNVVFWNWKANGGTTSSNSDGSITSTVQANTTAGFSIVTYNGTGATATVGHGLGSVPKMLIFKNRDNDQNWRTYHVALGETKAVVLDGNGASQTYDFFNDTAPTSSVFSLSSHEDANRNGDKIVAYCFADIEGYSKFGSYTGNGNADGPFVHTGFRPAFLMIKNTTSSADWVILDTKRNTYNPVQNNLYPSSTATEGTGNLIDYVSNGFKCRFTYSTSNNDAKVYIYMAFAENPFKYANAR